MTVHPVDRVDGDGAAAAEEDDEDGEADRGLGGGDGQDEHRQHLSREVSKESGESDQVDVDREQDQLDRHQHQDDVDLGVEDVPGIDDPELGTLPGHTSSSCARASSSSSR